MLSGDFHVLSSQRNVGFILRQVHIPVISVGFWRWCVSIERIVLLDFIHRLVSQKIGELRIYTKYHNTHVHKIHTRVNY
jgi:hypothetical protein